MEASSLHRCRLPCERDLLLLCVPICQKFPPVIRFIHDLFWLFDVFSGDKLSKSIEFCNFCPFALEFYVGLLG